MSEPEGTCMNLTGVAVDQALPATSGNSVVTLIDAGNALEEQGRIAEAMAHYDAAVQADPRCARAHLNRGNILLASAQIDAARSAYQLAIACDPRYAAAHFNLGNLKARGEEYEHALHDYETAIRLKPDFADAFVAMGNAYDSLGRSSEAIESYQRALAISPSYAEVHFNLAKVLHRLGDLDAAEASVRQALSIAPESDEILYGLAILLVARGKFQEALHLVMQGLERTPTRTIKAAFAYCVARTKSAIREPGIRAALTAAITEPWASPVKLSLPALSLLMLDPHIGNCVRLVNQNWPAHPPKAQAFDGEVLATLAADPLLHALLEAVPVRTIEFERFLTSARQALLQAAASDHPPDASDLAALRFYAALARQCFVNEYIFDCDDSEQAAAAACRTKLLALLDANAVVPPLLLLAVGAYFPLYRLPESARLLTADQQGPVADVLRQQIREPLEEAALRTQVKCLTSIADGVSEKVRAQYEENPYPRWVKIPAYDEAQPFNAELRRNFPLARFTPLHDDSKPEVLVAGCGTGSQSILTARSIRGARILAIDLSLASITYAIRKTQELGIASIEYAQADILKLEEIPRTFDIIASGGVLHHLADPFLGWRTLLSRLRPGGFMHLGFYSQLARRHVAKARELIAALGYASTPDDIRRFRRDLVAGKLGVDLQRLTKSQDFYSTSECRDLLFHVQEHRLTLDQIESFISELGLQFIGFEVDSRVLHAYRTLFKDDPAGTKLRNWARFEADNPDTFIEMYQFWIQKPIAH